MTKLVIVNGKDGSVSFLGINRMCDFYRWEASNEAVGKELGVAHVKPLAD